MPSLQRDVNGRNLLHQPSGIVEHRVPECGNKRVAIDEPNGVDLVTCEEAKGNTGSAGKRLDKQARPRPVRSSTWSI